MANKPKKKAPVKKATAKKTAPKVKRGYAGRLQKGTAPLNPNGKPKGSRSGFTVTELKEAIREVEKEKKKPLLKHFIERAYDEDKVLVNAIRKMIPDLKSVEIKGSVDGDFHIKVERE